MQVGLQTASEATEMRVAESSHFQSATQSDGRFGQIQQPQSGWTSSSRLQREQLGRGTKQGEWRRESLIDRDLCGTRRLATRLCTVPVRQRSRRCGSLYWTCPRVDCMVLQVPTTAVVCFFRCEWTYESLKQESAYFPVVLFQASFALQCVFPLVYTRNCLLFVERKRIRVSITPRHAYSDSPLVGDLGRSSGVFQELGLGQFFVTTGASICRFHSSDIGVKQCFEIVLFLESLNRRDGTHDSSWLRNHPAIDRPSQPSICGTMVSISVCRRGDGVQSGDEIGMHGRIPQEGRLLFRQAVHVPELD